MMSTLKSYEFQCPQFVDFLSGIEGQGSPKVEIFGSSSPAIKDVVEFKVPKTFPKNIRSTHFNSNVRKTFANAALSTNITDSVKLTAKKILSKRLSRSDSAINLAPKHVSRKKLDYFTHRKRSLSESDLRSKKKILATTPMCLKRTIKNVKSKKIKSSEEMEMEKIAELQKQMHKHLRANEIAMKRQKIKQTSNFHKELAGTEKKEKRMPERKPVKNSQRDYILEKINAYAKNACAQVQKEEAAAKEPTSLHAEPLKKANILKKTTSSSSDRFLQDLIKPMASQRISEATFAKMSISTVLKELPVKKADAHRGLLFTTAQRKPAIRPFNFQDTIRDLSSSSKSGNGTMHKAEPSNSMHTPRLIRNKENSAAMKDSRSIVKSGRRYTQKKTEP